MKKFVLFLVLMAVLLSACGTYEDVSSIEIPDELYDLTPKSTELNLPFAYMSATFKDEVFTEELIAVSYTEGARKENMPLYVLTSFDNGETWNETVISDRTCYQNFLSFSSKKNGFLVVQGEYGLGRQGEAFILFTHDGGKTWQEVTSTTSVCNWLISDVLLIAKDVGFVCYDYNAELQPVFCRTKDGGFSWERVVLQTEDIINKKADYSSIESAEYKDGVIIFSVRFYAEDSEYLKNFISTDFGENFTEEK